MGKVVLFVCVCLFVLSFVGAEYDGIAELDLPESGFVMRSEALAAIGEAEGMIERMKENNFSVVGVSEDLAGARRAFQMVDYSEVLRNASASVEDRWEAIRAVGEEDWSRFHYGDVIEYTDSVLAVGEKAFLSYESLVFARIVYEEYLEKGGLC